MQFLLPLFLSAFWSSELSTKWPMPCVYSILDFSCLCLLTLLSSSHKYAPKNFIPHVYRHSPVSVSVTFLFAVTKYLIRSMYERLTLACGSKGLSPGWLDQELYVHTTCSIKERERERYADVHQAFSFPLFIQLGPSVHDMVSAYLR